MNRVEVAGVSQLVLAGQTLILGSAYAKMTALVIRVLCAGCCGQEELALAAKMREPWPSILRRRRGRWRRRAACVEGLGEEVMVILDDVSMILLQRSCNLRIGARLPLIYRQGITKHL